MSKKDREELMGIISDPGKRQAFLADPDSAKKGGAVNELVDTLAGMSGPELDAVAKLNKALVDKGHTEDGSTLLAEAV